MLNFFNKKRKEIFKIVSPVTGRLINLNKVNDGVFSSGIMGDGFAVIPTKRIIGSPINGKVEMVFPTKHAVGLKTNDGIEIIIHVGIDTVELNGKGFSVFVQAGDKIEQGQKIISISEELFNDRNVNLVTIVVFPNNTNLNVDFFDKTVELGEGVIENDTSFKKNK